MEHQVVSFNAKDLIRVLKTCRQLNVTELKVGDIEVKFGSSDMPEQQKMGNEPPITDDEFQQAALSNNVKQNFTTAEERLALLQVENPVEYERLLFERELEDSGKSAEIPEH